MQGSSLTTEQILTALQDNGFRLTAPRRVIVESVQEFDQSFSADDLLQVLDGLDPSVGRATVFRTLDILAHLGLLDRIHSADGCHTYILGKGQDRHYHHLICYSCGTVVQFDGCNIESMLDELTQTTNFQISGHMLEIFGLCDTCQG